MCEPAFVVRPSSVYTVALYEKTRYLSSSILREAWRLAVPFRWGLGRLRRPKIPSSAGSRAALPHGYQH